MMGLYFDWLHKKEQCYKNNCGGFVTNREVASVSSCLTDLRHNIQIGLSAQKLGTSISTVSCLLSHWQLFVFDIMIS